MSFGYLRHISKTIHLCTTGFHYEVFSFLSMATLSVRSALGAVSPRVSPSCLRSYTSRPLASKRLQWQWRCFQTAPPVNKIPDFAFAFEYVKLPHMPADIPANISTQYRRCPPPIIYPNPSRTRSTLIPPTATHTIHTTHQWRRQVRGGARR
jgi:hypothetical protein